VRVGFPDGSSSVVSVAAVLEDAVQLDANHPLAGKPLTFELELVSID
jgi:peptidylprolyl isomerase